VTETAAEPLTAAAPTTGGFATPPSGLTADEVRARIAAGQVNDAGERTSRTVGEIVRANVFTRFNAILGTMLAIILVVGPLQDALFGIVLVANATIGIVQELRAKRTLDRLAVLAAPHVRVVRDGELVEVGVREVVLDDLVDLRAGDQIPADGDVTASDGLEVDESLLTGESDPVPKEIGHGVMSGSFVVAGSGRFQARRVGADSYAHRLAAEARRFTLVHSEIVAGLNRILQIVTYAIFPTAALLALSQFRAHDGWREAMAGVVAGVVAMVPEGLVLLTSIAFALAAVTLARRRVLVQELPAVEVLARVDVVCLDKTGTITEGSIVLDEVEHFSTRPDLDAALGALAADPDRNATMAAVGEAFPAPAEWVRRERVPFSSARKWSAAEFEGRGTWVLGAPEMIWDDGDHPVRVRADQLAATGRRVLLLAVTDAPLAGEELPPGLEPVALVVFEEKVRSDAAETLDYFRSQGVELRVISGDNPVTVGAVAARVGLERADRPFDARELPDDTEALAEILDERTVYGRVSPHQKRAMVGALQSRGHVVAMTGDGVNDALALKDADIGIAMGSGAPATRAVAQLVLLDGHFATMPGVVAEGRRVIANIERVANLFITKTVYAAVLAIAVGVARWPYPFLPRHLTIVSSLTIGIPGFFLALAPNRRRYVPGFVPRVARFAIPAGFIAAAATFGSYGLARELAGVGLIEARTCATLTLLVVGLYVLSILARPITRARGLLVAAMVGLFLLAVLVPAAREFFELDMPERDAFLAASTVAVIACVLLELGWTIVQRRLPPAERTPRVLRAGSGDTGAYETAGDVLREVLGLAPRARRAPGADSGLPARGDGGAGR
jgi:cation-transporting ATPase E